MLVDHNRLLPRFSESNPSATVVGIIDHHRDEGLYKSAKLRLIHVPTGSCTSLVTLYIRRTRGDNFTIPIEVATLLLSGVLIDTRGLIEDDKAVNEDHEAAAYLVPRSVVTFSTSDQIQVQLSDGSPVKTLSDELRKEKSSVESLTMDELLRRDYKQYNHHSSWTPDHKEVVVGLASVVLSLQFCIDREPTEFWEQVDSFMDDRCLDVLGILTNFEEETGGAKSTEGFDGEGTVRRQALFVIRDFPEGGIEERFWTGLEASRECGFVLRPFSEFTKKVTNGGVGSRKARAYEQSQADQSRKTIAPLVKKIIEGSTAREQSFLSRTTHLGQVKF